MTRALTLAAFTATRQRLDIATAAERLRVDADEFTPGAEAVWIYADSAWILETENGFYLIIGRSEYESDTLESLERRLWTDHYLQEIPDTLSGVDGTLDEFVRTYGEFIGVDWSDESKDWGGVFGIMFSGMDGDTISAGEARDLVRKGFEIYG